MPKNRKTRKEKIMSLNRQNTSVNKRVFVKTASPITDAPAYSIQPISQRTTEDHTTHLSKDLVKTTTLTLSVIIGELILFYVLQMHR